MVSVHPTTAGPAADAATGRTADPPPAWWSPVALVTSAALFAFGTGLTPIAVLAWFAPLPVFLLAPRVSARRAAVVAYGASFLGTATMWPYYLTARPIPIPVPVAVVIVLGTAALFSGSTLLLRALVLRGLPVLAALATPAAWAAGVYLSSMLAGGIDVSSPTSQQTDLLPVLQITALTGVWGVSFLVFLPAATVAAACSPVVTRAARWRAGATGLVLLLAALGYGGVRLATAPAGSGPRMAVVDHGQTHWEVDPRTPDGQDLVRSYVEHIRALPADVRTVVLPEGGFSATGTAMPALVDPLTRAALERNTDVVVGAIDRRSGPGTWENIALVLPGDGSAPARYVKHHEGGPQYRTGTELTVHRGAGVEICLDSNFTEPSRSYAQAGVRRVLMPANDTNVDGAWHARVALTRGVENGFSVAWSATRGHPLIADGYGRILAEARTTAPGDGPFATISAPLPDGPGATVYTHLGDWFPLLCLAVTGLGVVAVLRPRARTRRPGREA